uniref:Uncharacterized protein n=1 Tax=Peronospora matthiolae TaxID=2874970 RepID=A0AAV1UTH5_9STRA
MVRMPRSSGGSGFYRESLSEEAKINAETGIEASEKERSWQTHEDKGSPDRQSFGKGFDDKKKKRKIDFTI